jgi:hypothetical protein
MEEVDNNLDSNEDEFEVTSEDLENLNAQDKDQDKNEQDEIIGNS